MAVNIRAEDVYEIYYLRAIEGDIESRNALLKSAQEGDGRSKELMNLLESYNIMPDIKPDLPEIRPFRWPSLKKIIGGAVDKIHQRIINRSRIV